MVNLYQSITRKCQYIINQIYVMCSLDVETLDRIVEKNMTRIVTTKLYNYFAFVSKAKRECTSDL